MNRYYTLLFRQLLTTALAWISLAGNASAKEWLIYERSELVQEERKTTTGKDPRQKRGDSLTVKAITGHTYHFRLLGVECPAVSSQAKTQLSEQTRKFKISSSEVLKWGQTARQFTREFLSEPFTVYTQKVKARGSAKQITYLAIIVNDQGERLSEALVKAGLARVKGEGAAWQKPFWGKTKCQLPKRMKARRYLSKLHAMESKAKRNKAGIWGAAEK